MQQSVQNEKYDKSEHFKIVMIMIHDKDHDDDQDHDDYKKNESEESKLCRLVGGKRGPVICQLFSQVAE